MFPAYTLKLIVHAYVVKIAVEWLTRSLTHWSRVVLDKLRVLSWPTRAKHSVEPKFCYCVYKNMPLVLVLGLMT
jgi:hypothetical protein